MLFVMMKMNLENNRHLYRKQNNFYFDDELHLVAISSSMRRKKILFCKNNSKSRVDHGEALIFTITLLKLIPALNVCKARGMYSFFIKALNTVM